MPNEKNLPATRPANISAIPITDKGVAEILCTPEGVELAKRTLGEGLTNNEFALFIALCKRTGADPWAKDVYPVKYGGKLTTPFNYHFYVKKAQALGDYVNHYAKEVYAKDEYTNVTILNADGQMIREFRHNPAPVKERGELLGAYCLVWVKGLNQPYSIWVDYAAVNLGQGNWKKMPGWMCRKCAIAAAFREAFAAEFRGCYVEEELGSDMPDQRQSQVTGNLRREGVEVTPQSTVTVEAKAKPAKAKKTRQKASSKVSETKPVQEQPPASGETDPDLKNAMPSSVSQDEDGNIVCAIDMTKDNVEQWLADNGVTGVGIKMVLRQDTLPKAVKYACDEYGIDSPWGS